MRRVPGFVLFFFFFLFLFFFSSWGKVPKEFDSKRSERVLFQKVI